MLLKKLVLLWRVQLHYKDTKLKQFMAIVTGCWNLTFTI